MPRSNARLLGVPFSVLPPDVEAGNGCAVPGAPGFSVKNEAEKGKSFTVTDLREERGVCFHYWGVVETPKMKMNIAEGSMVSPTWNRPLSNPYTAKLTGGKGADGWSWLPLSAVAFRLAANRISRRPEDSG
jgi:hypothetical protein